jgi:hypothetical protein
LDVALVDEVLFPLLFKQKYLPYSLHLDIRMVQNITIYPLIMRLEVPANRPQMVPGKVPPFAKACSGPTGRWGCRTHLGMLRSCGQEDRLTNGRHGSKFRRKKTHKRNWGSVDILNELRDLKHPRMGYHSTDQGYELEEECDLFSEFDDEFVNAYLRLEEDEMIPGTSDWCIEREKSRMMRYKFVNGFLDYLIETGKRASWGGMSVNPEFTFEPILSN